MQIESDFHEAMRAEYAVCFGAVTVVSDGPGWTGRSGDVDKPGYVADGFDARSSAAAKLELSRRHLQRVLAAWDPPDWPELALFGFYALEAAIEAAALQEGLSIPKAHWARAQAAEELASRVDLADVSALLRDLNEARKSEAYGDVASPDLDASEIASRIEAYVEAVERLLEESGS